MQRSARSKGDGWGQGNADEAQSWDETRARVDASRRVARPCRPIDESRLIGLYEPIGSHEASTLDPKNKRVTD
jgi:hypothetical protein